MSFRYVIAGILTILAGTANLAVEKYSLTQHDIWDGFVLHVYVCSADLRASPARAAVLMHSEIVVVGHGGRADASHMSAACKYLGQFLQPHCMLQLSLHCTMQESGKCKLPRLRVGKRPSAIHCTHVTKMKTFLCSSSM